MSVLSLLQNSGVVQVFGGTPAAVTFADWLASTASGAGPTRYWAMDDTSGTTMTADIGGINGTYQNTANLQLNITDAEAEKWVGFGGAATDPGYATIVTPLQSAAFTTMIVAQFDLVKAKHILLTTGNVTTPGQFSFEVVDDGASGLKPRCWSVNASTEAVIYSGTNTGTVPVGDWCALFYLRRSDGTQEVWRVSAAGVAQIALTLDSGTPPGSWAAHPTGTWYVGTWPNFTVPLNGVARSLALWNVALTASDIQALGAIVPSIQNVVWAGAIDAGTVTASTTKAGVDISSVVHPEVGYTASIQVQGTLGTWSTGSAVNLLDYAAGGSNGTDTAGRYRITRSAINSANGALTIQVGAAAAVADLPYFGEYYGGGCPSNTNGQYEFHHNYYFFFYAERTGVVDGIQWHVRSRNPEPGYSAGDGGTYTIQIVPANASTKMGTGGAAICRLTGYHPGNPSGSIGLFPELNFSLTGQLVAGNPYCIEVINTHANPAANFVSQNVIGVNGFYDETNPSQYTEPGEGGGVGSIVVASGGINGDEVGGSASIVRGWTPIRLNGHDWYPFPIGSRTDGTLRSYRRIGGIHCSLRYTNGVYTNWGRGSAEGDYVATINGSSQMRERFRVTRATRVVSGVFIKAWRVSGTGNLLVRLESGPENDTHTAANGTLIEEASVSASLFLLCGDTLDFNQVLSGSPTGLMEIPHYVWVPFSQNRTLTLGNTYNIRLIPSGCNLKVFCSARGDSHYGVSGRAAATWSTWASDRRVSWTAWEDSRGTQVSTNSGGAWAYGPAAARQSPITFKCVT